MAAEALVRHVRRAFARTGQSGLLAATTRPAPEIAAD
jgi:hypothetical protein